MKHTLICLALLGLSASPLALAEPPAAAVSELDAALAIQGDPVKGKVAYEVCRGCHKADGSGRADAEYPQLAGQHATVLIKQMADVRSGRRQNQKMHPFIEKDEVSTEDIAHIAAYLAFLPVPRDNGKGDGKQPARGKALYEKDCATCHGGKGEGNAAKFIPRVAGQHYGYLVRENKAIQSLAGNRRDANPDMVKVIKSYPYKDIAAVSDYMSRLGSEH
ncbi:MAG: c-type cytochrome [Thiobacillus sp.]|nr:c-type cytochrome [Thiobacillus sp.]